MFPEFREFRGFRVFRELRVFRDQRWNAYDAFTNTWRPVLTRSLISGSSNSKAALKEIAIY